MRPRSRHGVVVTVTLTYVLAWGVGVASGLVAAATVDSGEDAGWAALGMLVLGFLVGVLLGHVAWAVSTVWLLRPFHHPARTAATVVLTPVSLVVLMIGINELPIHWLAWPLAAVAAPAGLASWATRPRHGNVESAMSDPRQP